MSLETAVAGLVALSLPLWLVFEEIARHFARRVDRRLPVIERAPTRQGALAPAPATGVEAERRVDAAVVGARVA